MLYFIYGEIQSSIYESKNGHVLNLTVFFTVEMQRGMHLTSTTNIITEYNYKINRKCNDSWEKVIVYNYIQKCRKSIY